MNRPLLPVLLLAFVLLRLGAWGYMRCRSTRQRSVFFIMGGVLTLPAALLVVYYLHVMDGFVWFYEYRAAPLSDWLPAGAGVMAGGLGAWGKEKNIFRPALSFCVLILGLFIPYAKGLVGLFQTTDYSDRWHQGVCIQSTPSSCGPASAASILRVFGEEVSEEVLANESFTWARGTEIWYLDRALRRRGFSVRYRIEESFPLDLKAPAIIGVKAGEAGHFIALLELDEQQAIFGDPLTGRKRYPRFEVDKAFRFTGFYMEVYR